MLFFGVGEWVIFAGIMNNKRLTLRQWVDLVEDEKYRKALEMFCKGYLDDELDRCFDSFNDAIDYFSFKAPCKLAVMLENLSKFISDINTSLRKDEIKLIDQKQEIIRKIKNLEAFLKNE